MKNTDNMGDWYESCNDIKEILESQVVKNSIDELYEQQYSPAKKTDLQEDNKYDAFLREIFKDNQKVNQLLLLIKERVDRLPDDSFDFPQMNTFLWAIAILTDKYSNTPAGIEEINTSVIDIVNERDTPPKWWSECNSASEQAKKLHETWFPLVNNMWHVLSLWNWGKKILNDEYLKVNL